MSTKSTTFVHIRPCLELGFDVDINHVRNVIESWDKCEQIDLKQVNCDNGKLECWGRWACDVTLCCHEKFLSVIAIGPSRFAIW